jgi:hypothetical protein
MTNYAALPSYFWLASSRLKEPVQDDVEYTTAALKRDLERVRNAWHDCPANRDRDAIYAYLTAVFNLVAWWAAEDQAAARARKVLRLRNIALSDHDEPFAAIIRCTADPARVDKRTRSKWSRVMRYALRYKWDDEQLKQFIKRKGGINKCADRFTRCLRRRAMLRGKIRSKKLASERADRHCGAVGQSRRCKIQPLQVQSPNQE